MDNKRQENDSMLATEIIIQMWNGYPVRFDPITQRLSFTDMHKAAGGVKALSPYMWLRNQGVQALAQEITQTTNLWFEAGTGFEPYVTIQGGKNAGTWGCLELALAYAEYLDPKFWLWVLRTFVQARTGQLVPAAPAQAAIQTPASFDPVLLVAKLDALAAQVNALAPTQAPTSFDPAPLMAKLDALTARLDAMESAPSFELADMIRAFDTALLSALPKLTPPISVELAADMEKVFEKSLLETVPQVCKSAEDHQYFVSRKLHLLSLNWLYKVVGDILAERRAAESEAVPPVSPSPAPTQNAASDGFAPLMDALWKTRGAKPARAAEIISLDETSLFDADSPQGRALQFAREAGRREGTTFSVQDGSIKVTLRASARKPGVARKYWLEPKV